MDSLPLGLSIHHFVSSVGAEVGFASLIAVAILVLLYFAQARETATLRTRADEAGHRVQELEARLAQLTEQVAALPAEISVSRAAGARVAAPGGGVPGRVAAGVPASAGAAAVMLPPSAPAGVGAPALAAATRLIPDPDSFVREPEPEPATAAGGANGDGHRPVAAPMAAATTMHRPVQAPVGAPAGLAAPPPRGVPPDPVRGPGAGGPGRPVGATAQGRPTASGQTRPGGPPRHQGMPQHPPRRRSKGRLLLGGLVAALAVAAVAAGLIVLTNRGGSKSASTAPVSSSLAGRRTSQASVVRPSTVTVSVLNGTDMQGLAGHVAQRLVTEGYRKGAVTNASDQTQTTSVVAYMAPADRRDAIAVAAALKLTRASVQPIDASTKAIACPPAKACTSAVVVTIGRDLATQ
ncbi:MAG: LytR C-terminal domain-containing protein [Solirubrobacterales bacterium]|nr:LytR C-terminal domain-containing protein [Solirubrobacterales bacterium]MBV9367870.1 LytR C-terminal domain-containing protein [Solirubrobacterales bacterium]